MGAKGADGLTIRDYRDGDAIEIAELFHGAVHSLVGENYSAEELEAWAPTPPDHAHWRRRLGIVRPFVAERDGSIVGFIELEDDGHIDCFYTHRAHQRSGIGQRLYDHLLAQADARGLRELYVEASEIAKPFFERAGFVLETENRVERGGQVLRNFTMRLHRGLRHPGSV